MNNNYKETVLVVDDEVDILEAIERTLKLESIDTICFSDSEEAFAELRRNSYKTVITDIQMPNLSGTELIKMIKSLSQLCEVIVITGHTDINYLIKCFEAGCTDYFKKPLHDTDAFVKSIQFLIQKHQRWLSKDGLL